MSKLIDLNNVSPEALAEMANDAAEQAANNAKKAVQKAIDAGRYVDAAASQVPRGEWLAWQKSHLRFSQQTASKYRRLANYARERNLEAVETVNEAMRLMYDDAETQRSERSPSVTVLDPAELRSQDVSPIDVDPSPALPTNRQTSPDNKPAKEADKPKTRPVIAEIVNGKIDEHVAEWLAAHSVEEIIAAKNFHLTPMSFAGMAKRLHNVAAKYERNVKP